MGIFLSKYVQFAFGVGLVALSGLYLDFTSWKKSSAEDVPSTIWGYLRIFRWGLYLNITGEDLTDANRIPGWGTSYLSADELPNRAGPRPEMTRWTLPQRQKQGTSLEEPPDKRLLLLPSYFAGTHPYSKYFVLGKSKTECGTGPALCVRPEALNINPNAKNIFYEIAHVHPQDYSLHVYLSPRDARRVVERGWGLRFPVPWIAPPSWVMVYAPRDVEELRTVSRIVRAACCFAVGTELQKIPLWPPSLHQGVFCRCNYCIPYQEERETYWRESLKKTIPTRGDP